MVSREGLKTWFEYDVLIKTVLATALLILWALEWLVSFVETPAITPQFVLSLVGVSLLVLVIILWETGR